MKDSATLPLVYILLVALMLVFVLGFQLLYRWGVAYNPTVAVPSRWLVSEAASAFRGSAPISALAALFLLFPRIARRPGKRLLSFLGPFVACALLLTGGVMLGNRLCAGGACSGLPATQPFVGRTIHPMTDASVYVESVASTAHGGQASATLHQVVVADIPEATAGTSSLLGQGPAGITPVAGQGELNPVQGQVLRYATSGLYSKADSSAGGTITLSDGSSLPVSPANPLFGRMFNTPSYLKSLFDDVNILNAYLYNNFDKSRNRFFLAVIAITFLAMSCWIFGRLTRWPLFNVCLTLAVFRGILVLFRLLTSDLAHELASVSPDSHMAGAMPSLALLAFGVLIFIVDLLFVPYGRKRESPVHG